MAVPAKTKAKGKVRSPARAARRSARPSWAVTSAEEKKELDEVHERVISGREKLRRILL